MTIEQKKRLLLSDKRCFRCLKKNHLAKDCRFKGRCTKCGGKHAALICDPSYQKRKNDESNSPTKQSAIVSATKAINLATKVTAQNTVTNARVLLQTAVAVCEGKCGQRSARLLFDSGSQRTFVTKDLSMKLQCKFIGNENLTVGVFGGKTTDNVLKRVILPLRSMEGHLLLLEALEIDSICENTIPIPDHKLQDELRKLNCSEDIIMETESQQIDVLIGSDHYWDLVTGKVKKLGNKLRAVETLIGWTAHGQVPIAVTPVICS